MNMINKVRYSGRVQSGLLLSAVFLCSAYSAQSQQLAPESERMAKLIPGPVDVSIKEWKVPTAGNVHDGRGGNVHDVSVAPDGSIWYAGQRAKVVGRFDPKTETFKEYTVDGNPNDLVVNKKDGSIMYASRRPHHIGKIDPKTGKISDYQMPSRNVRNSETGQSSTEQPFGPHTPAFDQKGNVWFTVGPRMEGSTNMLGMLNPATGEFKYGNSEIPASKGNSYGIVVNSKGVPFFTIYRTNKLGSIDPVTLRIQEYEMPNPEASARRLAITPDDVIWYADSDRGYLGRLDPKTGEFKEWPTPSGPKSHPYGITTVGDIVWYSETAAPNTVVRFDPKTEKFQSWALPSGGGVVRNMTADPQGNLWLALSGINAIGKVEIRNR